MDVYVSHSQNTPPAAKYRKPAVILPSLVTVRGLHPQGQSRVLQKGLSQAHRLSALLTRLSGHRGLILKDAAPPGPPPSRQRQTLPPEIELAQGGPVPQPRHGDELRGGRRLAPAPRGHHGPDDDRVRALQGRGKSCGEDRRGPQERRRAPLCGRGRRLAEEARVVVRGAPAAHAQGHQDRQDDASPRSHLEVRPHAARIKGPPTRTSSARTRRRRRSRSR